MNAVDALNSITLANVSKSAFGGIQADIVAFNDVSVHLEKSLKVHVASNVPMYKDKSYAGRIKLLLPLSGVNIRKLDKSSYLIESGPYNLFGVVVKTGNFWPKSFVVNTVKLNGPAQSDPLGKDTYGLILTKDDHICVRWGHRYIPRPDRLPGSRLDYKLRQGECNIDLAGRVIVTIHNDLDFGCANDELDVGCAKAAAGCVMAMLALILIAILFVVVLGIIAGAITGFKEALAFTGPSISAVGSLI